MGRFGGRCREVSRVNALVPARLVRVRKSLSQRYRDCGIVAALRNSLRNRRLHWPLGRSANGFEKTVDFDGSLRVGSGYAVLFLCVFCVTLLCRTAASCRLFCAPFELLPWGGGEFNILLGAGLSSGDFVARSCALRFGRNGKCRTRGVVACGFAKQKRSSPRWAMS